MQTAQLITPQPAQESRRGTRGWHPALPCAELTVTGAQSPHQPSLVILGTGAGGTPGEQIAGSSLDYLFCLVFLSFFLF